MTTREIHFYNASSEDTRTPYILGQEPIEYTFDGKEGSIYFDGYYYVEDHAPPYPEDDDIDICERERRHDEWLPKKAIMFTTLRETEPSKVETREDGSIHTEYNYLEKDMYMIEIYKREKDEVTNQYSDMGDEYDGMKVCFFPTRKQRIFFRVLETL